MFLETNRFTLRYLAISTALFSIAIGLIRNTASANFCVANNLAIVGCSLLFFCLVVPMLLLATACFTISWLPMSRHHSMITGFAHFLLLTFVRIAEILYWRWFDKMTKNPRKMQEQFLQQILKNNANTEYGKLHGFANIKDGEDYRAKHPLTDYEAYRAYIDRIAEKGEQNLLTKADVNKFNASSGTTGKCKLLPCTTDYLKFMIKTTMMPYFTVSAQFLKHELFVAPLKASMQFFVPNWRYSPSNIPIGPMSSFPKKQSTVIVSLSRTLPAEAEVYMTEPGQCYLHWLFALYDKDIIRLDYAYAGIMVWWLEVLQKNWEKLVADIRQGRIDRVNKDIPAEVIDALEKAGRLWPDPKRADEVQAEFSKGFEGIIGRLWPRLHVVNAIITGAQNIYVERLRWFCGSDVTFVSPTYAASEATVIGMNVDPKDEEQLFTLLPHMNFLEFIPEEKIEKANPQTLFIDQVQVGKRYELVVTSILGFYRYRMGDVLEIARLRHGKTPVVRFCGRVGTILDLRAEKTSEDMIQAALMKATPKWEGCQHLEDYTTSECISLAKCQPTQQATKIGELFYVLFVEAEGLERQLTPEEAVAFDENLQEVNFIYKGIRLRNGIGEPRIFIVKKGTFAKLKEMTLVKNCAVSNQYKTPRYLTDEERLRYLLQSSF